MTRSAYDILTEAQERIRDPQQWAQGHYAYTKTGRACDYAAKGAVCWCAMGTLYKSRATKRVHTCIQEAADGMFSRAVIGINDILGHDAVMRMFDRARELAKEASDD